MIRNRFSYFPIPTKTSQNGATWIADVKSLYTSNRTAQECEVEFLSESQRDGQKGELTRDQSYSQEDPTMITDSDVPF